MTEHAFTVCAQVRSINILKNNHSYSECQRRETPVAKDVEGPQHGMAEW